ncbi:MAG TPA: PDDEXK nuclease domain-containing protein [Nitrospira sp.]|nr:PDDEXK nuclease domain-containing protein [Nitrospira sp.]HNA87463.1 PDDEXK nuclease domain-containing protein [Nitrospira sp.]HNG04451.1 PDDEXK nuclease domain-containing protein [Nitrospira sp.]HNO34538.1 PDDEXK nuclease domain-containing protein [Nitrospira sp.]
MIHPVASSDALLHEIRALIEDARRQVAHAANAGLTIAYWRIGKRLLTENLTDGRGEYGQQILASLAQQLERDYGKGFSYSALTRMARFAELFPDERILVSLIQELTWTHFIALLPLKDPLAREFYAEMCRVERWSVRTLRQKIGGMLFERTALSKNSPEVVRQELATLRDGRMTPDMVFRDPYLLDFLGLSGAYSEKDLEAAILREMESFLLEMGNGFCFVERQKRMSVGKDDFYLDLLFYHRHLRRLVAIELKLESFQPSHKGQMELYLRWLDKHERAVGEEPPIGLILCASADAEQVELLQLDESSIRVAEYLVELPPVAVLRERLHRAIEHARERTALASPEGDQE